jgi:acetyl-CoA/propionyl-CoA carboxylase biotin carboxyl carrier protein
LEIAIVGTLRDACVTVERHDPLGTATTSSVGRALRGECGLDVNDFFVTVDGRDCRAFAASYAGVTWVWMSRVTHVVHFLPRTRSRGDSSSGEGDIRSPVPGVVIKVNVISNGLVESCDRLVVMKAMKMENELVALFSGFVFEVLVAVGDQVDVNRLLLNVELTCGEALSVSKEGPL